MNVTLLKVIFVGKAPNKNKLRTFTNEKPNLGGRNDVKSQCVSDITSLSIVGPQGT